VVDAQGDALPGQVEPGADLPAADAHAAARADGPLRLDGDVGGQRAGWQGSGECGPGRAAAGGTQPGQASGVQGDRAGLEQLALAQDVQGGAVQPDGHLLPRHRLAEPDLASSGEHVPAGGHDPADLHCRQVTGGHCRRLRGRGRGGRGDGGQPGRQPQPQFSWPGPRRPGGQEPAGGGWPCPATGAAGGGCSLRPRRPARPGHARGCRTGRGRSGAPPAGSCASVRSCPSWGVRSLVSPVVMPFSRQIRSNSTSAGQRRSVAANALHTARPAARITSRAMTQ
jgi:hypothetical protein